MQRFVVKLVCFSIAILLSVVMTVAYAVYMTNAQVERVYNINPNIGTIFLGSSQVGCSIVEKPQYHNLVIWSSEKTVYSSLARLHELERRGQLAKIKNCIVYWNVLILRLQRLEDINRSWWKEFPVTWNKWDDFPSSRWSKINWIAEHLQWPMDFSVKSSMPDRKLVIAEQSEQWKQNFYEDVTNSVASFRVEESISNWSDSVKKCYMEMARICRDNDVRFIVVGFPILNTISPFYSVEHHQGVADIVLFFIENDIEYRTFDSVCDETVFFDAVHMIEKSASQYTENLYRNLSL